MATDAIRVLIVDDHPAVRRGIEAVLRLEPDLEAVASCASAADAVAAAQIGTATVAVVDYDLGDADGLALADALARRGTRVLVYTAYSQPALVLAARLAGASGLLHKSSGGTALCAALREVARGATTFPRIEPEDLQECGRRVDVEDLPILGMMVEGHSRDDVAETLRLPVQSLESRLARIVERVRPPTRAQLHLA